MSSHSAANHLQPQQYQYDGTFSGLLSAIFCCFSSKENVVSIFGPQGQPNLFAKHRLIGTSESCAERVWNGVSKVGGTTTCNHLYHAFLSAVDGVEMLILNYCKQLFDAKTPIYPQLGNPTVIQIYKLNQKVVRESLRALMFIRFEQATDGTYFAPFAPKYDVLPLVVGHFRDRFANQSWLIYDTMRNYGFHFDGRIVERVVVNSPNFSRATGELLPGAAIKHDEEWQDLWSTFFKSIAIKERQNLLVQRNFMPKRFWKYLTEKKR